MPSRSEAQRKMIFAKRNKYKAKENTPAKWLWIWDMGYENKGNLPEKVEASESLFDKYLGKLYNEAYWTYTRSGIGIGHDSKPERTPEQIALDQDYQKKLNDPDFQKTAIERMISGYNDYIKTASKSEQFTYPGQIADHIAEKLGYGPKNISKPFTNQTNLMISDYIRSHPAPWQPKYDRFGGRMR